ncbi:hypothetical protein R1sor_004229 [Riccia sorocarpa]|uniref:Uncharacterized protein n=1 Tax=Riccia sorocarpa TaxID=122646 RepID=A0ABD3H3W9_9MARC
MNWTSVTFCIGPENERLRVTLCARRRHPYAMPTSGETCGWAITIEAALQRAADAQDRRNTGNNNVEPIMFKVPPYIRTLQPRAYNPRVLSFGLYNRDFQTMSRMDKVRLEVVSAFLELLKTIPVSGVDSWEALCTRVAGPLENAPALRELYDDGPEECLIDAAGVRAVLTLDAVYLTNVILSFQKSRPAIFKGIDDVFRQKVSSHNLSAVLSDIWLFENQLPLSLVRAVWNTVYGSYNSDEQFSFQLQLFTRMAMDMYLLPHAKIKFEDSRRHDISYSSCTHLLHCLYNRVCHLPPSSDSGRSTQLRSSITPASSPARALTIPGVFPGLHIVGTILSTSYLLMSRSLNRILELVGLSRPCPPEQASFEQPRVGSLLPVSELLKGGIVVSGRRTSVTDLQFVRSNFYKATLYLPQIDIDDNTEMILRSLVSYEMIHGEGEHKLISYLSIMDDLINTEEDVRLLRKGKTPVIAGVFLGEDKDIASLFNALGQNISFRKSKECQALINNVSNWCAQERRQKFIRFTDRFRDRPWIIVSLAAATVLLLMTAAQTTYAILSYHTQ